MIAPAPRARARRPGQLAAGRHGLTPAEVAASQRERILRAIADSVAVHGFEAARIDDVTGRAGVSRRTFYELFESKEDCFAEACEDALRRLVGLTAAAYASQRAWADRLRAGLTALLGSLAAQPAVARLCFVEPLAAGRAVIRRRDDAFAAFSLLFDAPAVQDRPLAAALARGRMSELGDVLRAEIEAGRAERLPDRVPQLMYALVLPFLGRRPRRPSCGGARAARSRRPERSQPRTSTRERSRRPER